MKTVLHLGISYACNMHCKHCFVDRQNDRFDFDYLKKAISYLVDNSGLLIVYYTYGEPFLGKNLYNVMEFCNSLGLIQIIMSNGSTIDDWTCEAIRKYNINRIYISLDSSKKEKHDAIRGCLGAYDKAVEAIKRLSNYGVNVGIATTVNEINANDIYGIVQIAEQLGVSALSLLRERNRNRQIQIEEDSEYFAFFKEYLTKKRKIALFVHDYELKNIIKDAFDKGCITENDFQKWTDMNTCHAELTISIAPNGDVFSCNLAKKRYGNIYDETISDILNNMENNHDYFICCP